MAPAGVEGEGVGAVQRRIARTSRAFATLKRMLGIRSVTSETTVVKTEERITSRSRAGAMV